MFRLKWIALAAAGGLALIFFLASKPVGACSCSPDRPRITVLQEIGGTNDGPQMCLVTSYGGTALQPCDADVTFADESFMRGSR